MKYNPIQKGEEGDGFQTPNIVAYFAEIMPDGQLKDLHLNVAIKMFHFDTYSSLKGLSICT